jgi:hypothetical protein
MTGMTAVLTALCAFSATADEARQSAFGPGEQTTYRVEYLGMHAGTAEVTVGAATWQWGREVLPIVAVARSEKVLSFYPIRDRFVTYWDTATERCVGSDFFMDENRVKRRQRIKLDHDTGKATVVRQEEGKEERVSTYDVTAGAHDMAAATFALRNLPLGPGRVFELPVFTGRRSFTLKATVEGTESLATATGRKDVYRVRVQTGFDGKFVAKRDIVAWMTADDAKVPVRVEADFVLGTLRADLLDYKSGRRYALSPAATPVEGSGGG